VAVVTALSTAEWGYVWIAVAVVFLGPVIAAATGALVHAVRVAAGDVGCTPAPREDAPAATDDGSIPYVLEIEPADVILNDTVIERFRREQL
jgi:hypothetical protein